VILIVLGGVLMAIGATMLTLGRARGRRANG
jgi:hypothetical protein